MIQPVRDLAVAWRAPLITSLLLAQFLVRGELSLREESPVWDEPLHMQYGLNFLLGKRWPAADHPYPITAVLALPLAVQRIAPGQRVAAPSEVMRRFDLRDWDHPANLWPPRRVNLLLGALSLLVLSALARRRLGPELALYFLVLGSLDPSWIAASHYATTDIALGSALALAALLLGGHEPGHRWRGRAGLSLALAVALWSKFSGVLLLPAVLSVGVAGGTGDASRRVLRALGETALVTLCGGVLYLSVFMIQGLVASGRISGGLVDLWQGLGAAIRMQGRPRGVFLAGHFYPQGTCWYFPLLLLTKTPLTLLLLLLIPACFASARRLLRQQWRAFVLPSLFLATAVLSRINLGLRHLTPVMPSLWLIGAVGVVAVRQRTGRLTTGALVMTLLLEVCLAHPHYLPFTNAAAGGLEGAYRIAVDASSDWGQALPSLARYLREHPPRGGPVHLAYFGKGDPTTYGIHAVWRPCGRLGSGPWPGPRAGCADPAEVLAISATCLQGETTGRTQRDDCYAGLRGRVPSDVVAGSILIFRHDRRDGSADRD